MKFNGNTLSTRNHKEVRFRRGDEVITLIVSAVPRRFWDDMRKKGAYKTVTVPEKAIELRKNIYEKDASGRVLFKPDYEDAKYLEESRKNNSRFGALRIWYGLRLDKSVEWNTVKPEDTAPPEAWAAFADSLAAEVTDPDTGFEDGEITQIGDAIDACDLFDAAATTEEKSLENF